MPNPVSTLTYYLVGYNLFMWTLCALKLALFLLLGGITYLIDMIFLDMNQYDEVGITLLLSLIATVLSIVLGVIIFKRLLVPRILPIKEAPDKQMISVAVIMVLLAPISSLFTLLLLFFINA